MSTVTVPDWPKGAVRRIVLKALWRIPALVIVPFFLLTARRVKAPHQPEWSFPDVPRYELWGRLRWAETPDEYLPGGLYEKTILKRYGNGNWWRRWWTAYTWIATRNVAHDLEWRSGHEITEAQVEAYRARDIVTIYGPLAIFTGWKVMNDWHGRYTKEPGGQWAVPRFSTRWATRENKERAKR